LRRVLETFPTQVRLRLVGFQLPTAGPAVRAQLGALDPNVADIAHVEWVPHGERYLVEVGKFDIWVAPYQDTAFNRAKFPTKALEAGFWGIPLVTSQIRPYEEWFSTVHEADHPRLVSEYMPHEWSRQLRQLIERPELRRRYGEAARSRAALLSLQEVGRQWEAALFG
jgi:glycosyltransferase involved in cell wall biosynthesis